MNNDPVSLWYFIGCLVLMALTSFMCRLSFIALSGKFDLDERIKDALQYIPAAAFPAMFVPAVIFTRGSGGEEINIPQICAGILALAIAMSTRNVYFTLIGGMCAYWLARSYWSGDFFLAL